MKELVDNGQKKHGIMLLKHIHFNFSLLFHYWEFFLFVNHADQIMVGAEGLEPPTTCL